MKRVITSLLAILFVLPMVFPLAACTTETGGENMANYLTFSSENSFTISVKDAYKYWNGTLEYSTDGSSWAEWGGETSISSGEHDGKQCIYMRGIGNSKITGSAGRPYWVLTGTEIRCTGNIETLLDYETVADGGHPAMAAYCYNSMFQGCTSLVTAPSLPATTLAENCYYYMFYGCSSLVEAPALPATTLAENCYSGMFRGCSSLVAAPALPATTLADHCYDAMFYGCSSLTVAPMLPATTLTEYCYCNMFRGCTGLAFATAQSADYPYEYRIPTNGEGTEAKNALLNMFTETGGTFTGTPEINTTLFAASGGSKLTISTGGSANGDGMALYNGEMAIALPEYDESAYSYAILFHGEEPGVAKMAMLYLSSSPFFIANCPYTNKPKIYVNGSCSIKDFIVYYDISPELLPDLEAEGIHDGEWVISNDRDVTTDTAEICNADGAKWSNYDVPNTIDNTIYLAGSDPIPLDGMNVITWDGDTTGMESYVATVHRIGDYIQMPTNAVGVLDVGESLVVCTDVVEEGSGIWYCMNAAMELPCVMCTDGSNADGLNIPSGMYVYGMDNAYATMHTTLFAYPASSGGVTDTTATVNFSCTDLLYTDSVYRIKAWVYEPSGWSYNGVEMPELPVVDGCPYAVMYKSNNSYDLFLSAQKLYVNEGKTATYVSEAGDFVFYSEYISKSKQWHYQNTYPFSKDELHSRFSLANLCWSNYDILNADGSVYLAASEPVPGGLDVTQPATWTSDLFAGPSHSESHTFTGLTPATEYGIYAAIWSETDQAATEHNATATFTTLEGEEPTGTVQFGAVNITGTGFTAVIEASGLDDATAYTAEIVVYNTATSAVAAEAVRSFTGNYTMAIDFAGLTPETDYTVSVDVYPTDTGKVVARGEFPVATGQEEPKTSWRDSFLLGFASGLGCTAATKTDADHNTWLQGYLVGDSLRKAL